MSAYRKTGIFVGALFITATVTAIISLIILGDVLAGPDYLTASAEAQTRVVLAVIFETILAVSVMTIGILMFPVLKNVIESLALGYAVIRLVEGVFIVLGSIGLLSLFTLGQEYAGGSQDAANFQPAGLLALALRDWSIVFGTLIFLGLGGLVLNYLLFNSKLVPRWLSAWGFFGAGLILMTGILSLFGLKPSSSITTMLALPIAVQEMVFAVWLILKGFNPYKTGS
ncbi:MAG: DUF4386 domain-containing protein [Anaerolineales bacterium]|jgi:hypothetical protein